MNKSDVEPMKGAEYTFLHFLWKQIDEIRELQKKRYFQEALVQAIDLIDYLPNDFQDKLKFQEKAQKIAEEIDEIESNAEGVDTYTTMVSSLGDLDAYAKTVLKDFMAKLCIKLDAKGYMEKPPATPRFRSSKLGVPR